jgi:hypothetical protein
VSDLIPTSCYHNGALALSQDSVRKSRALKNAQAPLPGSRSGYTSFFCAIVQALPRELDGIAGVEIEITLGLKELVPSRSARS